MTSRQVPVALPDWQTKQEAAIYARVSVRTVERAQASGMLRAGGTPGRRLYRAADLDAWIAQGAPSKPLARGARGHNPGESATEGET